MTKRGFFIINGIPKVIISQVIRSPGIYYQERVLKTLKSNKTTIQRIFYADLISQRGTWLRMEMDRYKKIWIYMKKTSRIPFFLLLRALGFNRKSIFRLTSSSQTSSKNNLELNTTKSKSYSYAQKFLNPQSYNLGILGRQQLNQKLGLSTPLNKLTLTPNDWFACIEGLIAASKNKKALDDIDNLKNKRVRTAGEFIANQINRGLASLEKNISEKTKKVKKTINLKSLINASFINNSLKEFFASSQLSQYLDQTNPLAELTHKRRLSSLGPGGINRETAGMAVRSIHPTYYGRICPIETPEGKNAGLVNSITFLGNFNVNGFLETPYYLVYKGQVQKKFYPFFVIPKIENQFQILLNNIKLSSLNFLPKLPFPIRSEKSFHWSYRKNINYIIVSCFQLISLATSLIPFLEHDDANRALMGSNMQRQAVPVLKSQRPVVGTGLENVVVYDSSYNLYAKNRGFLLYKNNTVLALYTFVKNSIIESSCLYNFQNLSLLFSYSDLVQAQNSHPKVLKFLYFQTIKKGTNQNTDLESNWKNFLNVKVFNKVKRITNNANYSRFLYLESRLILHIEKTIPQCPNIVVFLKNHFQKKSLSINWYFTYFKTRLLPIKLFQDLQSYLLHKSFFISHLQVFLFWHHYFNMKRLYPFTRLYSRLDKPIQGPLLKTQFKYFLKTYNRTNQNTCLIQKPFYQFHSWIEKGELLTNTSFSNYGELSLGQNILVGYLPWEGYNFEDAVLINEKLVYEDIFTSLHIEKYEIQTRETPFGFEQITSQLPQISKNELDKLDDQGIIKIGYRVHEGDLLVGRVTPIRPKTLLPHEKLIYDIIGKERSSIKDSSLRVPKGVDGQVIDVQISELSSLTISRWPLLKVIVSILEQRKIKIGDKLAGRHGNKGIVSKILSRHNMPYLPNGTQLDMILNPLGVPSRMNVGQIFETLLGFSGLHLNRILKILPFDESYGYEFSRTVVYSSLYRARQKLNQKWVFSPNYAGKVRLFDGRTGQCLKFPIMVGQSYMMKLIHLVDEKIHARSTGSYSLVTQQPLRGRSKHGGQRFGEMEVWALEGFGAAYILQELLTVKSDDIKGRHQILESILNDSSMKFGTPESFKVLVREIQSLCLDVRIYNQNIYIDKDET